MAAYTIASDDRAAWGKSLAAGATDTATVNRDVASVRVYLDSGTTALWFTTDGSEPVANGGKCYRVRGTAGEYMDVDNPPGGVTSTIKVFSSGAVTYSIELSV